MQKFLSAALAATAIVLAGMLPLQAQQVASTIPAVLSICPDDSQTVCVPTVQEFIGQHPAGSQRDADLLALVVQLAGVAQDPSTTHPMCLDIADGIRTASGAVQNGAQAQEIMDIANALCEGGATTAATRQRNRPSSISSGSGPKPPPEPETPVPSDCCPLRSGFNFQDILKFEGAVVQVATLETQSLTVDTGCCSPT